MTDRAEGPAGDTSTAAPDPLEPDGGTAEHPPVPEYETDQYVPGTERDVEQEFRERILSEKFGPVRAYFKTRPDRHWKLQERLNQGRFGTTYDLFLTRAATYAAAAGIIGALVGFALAVMLAQTGALAGLSAPPFVPGWLARAVGANRVVIAGVASVTSLGLLTGGMTWLAIYYAPSAVVEVRRRSIDVTLPHAIVYMYALSFGGMEMTAVLRQMAAADDTYGEVAHEFDMIVRDVDVFGNDLFTAVRNARNITPSDNLEQFLDDLLSVLDSGGELTVFLEDESEKYMQRARDEQQSFLDALATLSEVFVVAFVAAPLFVVVTLMMLSLLGNVGTLPLAIIVYVAVPLGMAAFLVTISVLSEPYKQPSHELQLDDRSPGDPDERLRAHPHFETFQRIRRKAWLRERLSDPAAVFRNDPRTTLLVSVPIALAVLGGVVATGLAAPTPAAFIDRPVSTTALLVIAPFLIVAVPLSIFHEIARRRKDAVAKRLPDALDILASANQMGVGLTEGLDLVARNLTGRLAVELQRVSNDIRWNNDIRRALLGLADRLQVSQLTRTCKILAEGSRSTGDLHRVLDIAAEDTRHRYRLARDRQQTLSSYTAVVIIGFLVYLAVIVIINESFLGPITGSGLTSGGAGPVTISQGAVDAYRTLFFHSAIIQAVGTGLITGKLSDNRTLTGLKYSIALVLIAFGVFLLI
ncbi:type II secretion system F family protein [Haloglomus litoreum]|uniref:type II secretion system F family protein n=1 Tax=Haloglomus litoreum TaxID=3034026 RepID=UPI0023E8F76C|nr:type II secretion system F family protein [Haloglomus sp. DT116]